MKRIVSILVFVLFYQTLILGSAILHSGQKYKTSLEMACFKQDKEGLKKLLAKGADVNKQQVYGDGSKTTALGIVCRYADQETVKLLLEAGADKNQEEITTKKSRITPVD